MCLKFKLDTRFYKNILLKSKSVIVTSSIIILVLKGKGGKVLKWCLSYFVFCFEWSVYMRVIQSVIVHLSMVLLVNSRCEQQTIDETPGSEPEPVSL